LGSPAPDIHCKSPTWWQESEIYQKKRDRRRFIGIGSPPFNPQKTYECPIHEARRYERLIPDPFINSQAAVARELGNNDGKGGQVMGLLKLPEEIGVSVCTPLGEAEGPRVARAAERRAHRN